jgi:hypothetical protein
MFVLGPRGLLFTLYWSTFLLCAAELVPSMTAFWIMLHYSNRFFLRCHAKATHGRGRVAREPQTAGRYPARVLPGVSSWLKWIRRHKVTELSCVFLEPLTVAQLVNTFPALMETEYSSPCSQKAAIFPISETAECSSHPRTVLLPAGWLPPILCFLPSSVFHFFRQTHAMSTRKGPLCC